MSILARVFVILIFVCSIAYVAVEATLWHHSRDWRESYLKIKTNYEENENYYKRQIDALRGVAKNRDSIIEQRNSLITKLQDSIRAISDDLALSVSSYATVKQDMVTLLNDHPRVLEILKTKDDIIKSVTDARNDYKAQFEKVLRQKDTAEVNFFRLSMIKADLDKDIADLNKKYVRVRDELNEKELVLAQLQQAGIPIATIAIGMPAPPIDAKVVAVSPEVGLVVLSRGESTGVKSGYQFTIYNGEKFVAKVIVEKVLKDLCGCRVLFEVGTIEEGYSASTMP